MAKQVRSWIRSNPAMATFAFIAITAIALVGLLGVAQATEQPVFCSSCHEMEPYYEAWESGPHDGISCVECHVDSGITERVGHKFVALREVWVHATGEPLFPLVENAEIPDKRCLSCHADVENRLYDGFSHDDHAAEGPCITCHSDVGHDVTAASLKEAGILDPKALAHSRSEQIAQVGAGTANLPGHLETTCQNCHDMEATGCSSCHTPTHEARSVDCTSCHTTGSKWVFAHPATGECATCHEQAPEHRQTPSQVQCSVCHTRRGVDWAFTHPGETATPSASATTTVTPIPDCETCHARPAQHRDGICKSCHTSGGITWAYTHPAPGSSCATCHEPPAKHSAQSCANCHKNTGRTWAFSHPGSGSNCTSCHARPAGHSSAGCTSCHAVATTWAFKHPTSTSCASCHRAPAAHYGASCSACHTPAKAFASATFTHPSVPGGEHTYRSFSCASCHPSGYTRVNCTSCHEAEDDDD